MADVDTINKPTPVTTDHGDHERFSHIVFSPGRNAEGVVTEARVMGWPTVALCGKVWIPERDPRNYPICPECKEIRAKICTS